MQYQGEEDRLGQLDLFGEVLKAEQFSHVSQAGNQLRAQFDAYDLFGSSAFTHRFAQQREERGDALACTQNLFKWETQRMRLGILMFTGQVQ
jgi:hypothetical protein